ncbi:MAG TPA: S1/P1 nuclease [Longimicrobium sp.]
MRRHLFALLLPVVTLVAGTLLARTLRAADPTLAAPPAREVWGFEGHRIVCEIAWRQLDPAGRALVSRLRDRSYPTFAHSCTWADELLQGNSTHYTKDYHFINLPGGRTGIDMVRDCPAPRRCAPWAIRHYAERLANRNLSPSQRAAALKFLGHFVGDIHQPLHAGHPAVPGVPGNDRGGNWVQVALDGSVTNLHSAWDARLVSSAGLSLAAAQALAGEITSGQVNAWSNFDVVAWANESYHLADTLAYARTKPPVSGDEDFGDPKQGKPGPGYNIIRELDSTYEDAAVRAIRQRLQQAGVRLAHLINHAAAGDLDFPPD